MQTHSPELLLLEELEDDESLLPLEEEEDGLSLLPLLLDELEEDDEESLLPLLDDEDDDGSSLDEDDDELPLLPDEPDEALDSLLPLLELDSLLPEDEELDEDDTEQGSSHISGQTVQRPMKLPPALILRQTFGRQLEQLVAPPPAQTARPMPKEASPQETKTGLVTLKSGVPLMSFGQAPRKTS